jgi:hypothetical protein
VAPNMPNADAPTLAPWSGECHLPLRALDSWFVKIEAVYARRQAAILSLLYTQVIIVGFIMLVGCMFVASLVETNNMRAVAQLTRIEHSLAMGHAQAQRDMADIVKLFSQSHKDY